MPSFSWGPFCGYIGAGHLWFRIFGYGLHVKDVHKAPLLFSERNGLQGFPLGRLYVRPLWGYTLTNGDLSKFEPKILAQEFGSQSKQGPYVPAPPGPSAEAKLRMRRDLDILSGKLVQPTLGGRPDGKEGHYIFNAVTYSGRMRAPYAVLAWRKGGWVSVFSYLSTVKNAQEQRAKHCRETPETLTWVGPAKIAAWAVGSGKDPDTYRARRPKPKAKKRGRK